MIKLTEQQRQKIISLFDEPKDFFGEHLHNKEWYAFRKGENDVETTDDYFTLSIQCKDKNGNYVELECVVESLLQESGNEQ